MDQSGIEEHRLSRVHVVVDQRQVRHAYATEVLLRRASRRNQYRSSPSRLYAGLGYEWLFKYQSSLHETSADRR